MPKITKFDAKNVINHKTTTTNQDPKVRNNRWWLESKKSELASSVIDVVGYLKQKQEWRQSQAGLFAMMYGNLPILTHLGINNRRIDAKQKLPMDRPTMNVVQSCTDALVSRITQSKPKPMFLTEGGNWKKRKVAKDLNKFVDGEFYHTNFYQMAEVNLRDSIILGDGLVKIYENDDAKVALDRMLTIELFVDEADAKYGFPTQAHQLKIVDRDVVAACYPNHKGAIMTVESASFDNSSENQETIASQIMVVESWHLPSSKTSKDGRHVIVIGNDVLFDEDWEEDDFPFVKIPYSPRELGYWAQGLPEQLMGLQSEINKLLYTIQMSLHLCAIPRYLVEDGSKVVSAHLNNQIGSIVRYQGTKPELQVGPVLPVELYQQLERLVQMAYQQSGISQMAAASQKPAGLDSGAALREYDDLQSDRFAYLNKRYEDYAVAVAKKMFKCACKIAKRDKKYTSIYPGTESLLKIDLPKLLDEIDEDEFIIQAYPKSAFSSHPAQRKQEIIDMMQAGLLDPQEGRRLLDYPDLQQVEDLLNAPEERLLKLLDEMVEEGIFTPPDSTMELTMAKRLCLQYYNKYIQENLPEERLEMLRSFSTQIDALLELAMPPAPAMPVEGGEPQAAPMPQPVSPMVPNVPIAA